MEARGAVRDAPAVAHLIDPYLFVTGSWIHTQLVLNRGFRHIVLCQRTENLDLFPHEPVMAAAEASGPAGRLWSGISRRYLGRTPVEPYRRWAREAGAVLLHAHFGWEGCRACRFRRAMKLPLATTFYGLDVSREVRRPHWRGRYRALFPKVTGFFVEGSHMGRRLAEAGCPPDRIRVMPLGIDLERVPFRARTLASGEAPRVLFSGSFREKKGAPDAVAAFAQVVPAFPKAKLVMLGDGPGRGDVEAAIARGGCAASVELRGYVGYAEFVAELGAAHVLIAPSRTAGDGDTEGGAPVTVLEAQAAGLPVVSTTHCDIPEVTVPGESALLSPERDVPALAENLGRLLATRDPGPHAGAPGGVTWRCGTMRGGKRRAWRRSTGTSWRDTRRRGRERHASGDRRRTAGPRRVPRVRQPRYPRGGDPRGRGDDALRMGRDRSARGPVRGDVPRVHRLQARRGGQLVHRGAAPFDDRGRRARGR